MPHATDKVEAGQGIKPYPEYHLTAHRHAKQWCKKIGDHAGQTQTLLFAPNHVGSGTPSVLLTNVTISAIPLAPEITDGTPLPDGAIGAPYRQTLASTGGATPYTRSIFSGSLPTGLSLSTGGVISRTPSTVAVASFTVQVTGSNGLSSTKDFSLTINGPPVITSASPLPKGTVGVPYNRTLAATGGAEPYTWSISAGSLPSGLSLSSNDVVSRTPNAGMTAVFEMQVSGSDGLSSTKDFGLEVNRPASGALVQAGGYHSLVVNGDGTNMSRSVPAQVAGLTEVVAGGSIRTCVN